MTNSVRPNLEMFFEAGIDERIKFYEGISPVRYHNCCEEAF